MLTNRVHDASLDLRVDVIGGVLLITAPHTLGGVAAERLDAHLAQVKGRSRPVVVDLSRTDAVDDVAIAALREAWRKLGDHLRVVASPGSQPAMALRTAGLRRFAIHSSLSGALTQAST